jgi:hypothetical protein
MLASHKLARWLVPWGLAVAVVGLALLASREGWARLALGAVALAVVAAWLGWRWPSGRRMPRLLSLPTFFVVGNLAAMRAWIQALRGELNPVWEPTRREAIHA